MCCSLSFFYSLFIFSSRVNNFFVLQSVAVFCSLLQSVAVCCSLLQSLSLLCPLSVPRQQYSFPFPFSQVLEVFKILRFFCIFFMFSVSEDPLAFEIPHFFCVCSVFFVFQVPLAFEFTHFFGIVYVSPMLSKPKYAVSNDILWNIFYYISAVRDQQECDFSILGPWSKPKCVVCVVILCMLHVRVACVWGSMLKCVACVRFIWYVLIDLCLLCLVYFVRIQTE